MKQKLSNYALLTALMLFIGGCNTVGKTCITGGCYGPFEVTIKTKKGEKVEDVIVRLVHITPSGEGTTSTYSETALRDTDEKILFPFGFVYRSDEADLSLHLSIIHPDYEAMTMYASFPNKQGVIDLGSKYIRHRQDGMNARIPREEAAWRKAGRSEADIEANFKGKRKFNAIYRIAGSTKYFAHAVALGQEDIIDKYLPQMLRDDIEYTKSIGKPIGKDYEELYQIYYDAIMKRAKRYAK